MQTISPRPSDASELSVELLTLLKSIGIKKTVNPNTYIFQEGMEANEIYLIKSGLVQIGKVGSDGKELTLRIGARDDIIGELTLFTDDANYMVGAYAITDSEVLAISKDTLEKELIKSGPLTFEFMKWISLHLRKLQSKIRDLILNGKKGALYSTLIRLTNSYGIQQSDGSILIDIVLTNQEIANFCASARESINRMLSDLRKQKVISIQADNKIVIHDLEFLRNEIDCENCPLNICNID
ncbi:Crp/Fnr family transcriptional regulator [Radiobacillus deserti]|uniref:Crp/Fnr family transcriptional regulator n=1 Tax=Radiobacillus deserti TaxID=2594883 RepID=A0A516KI30_9BACI|nr:Crp/Fnr family transcriptional regulator [Radiobacillus deserti]QDP41049.1 Crp/Fnr family transcriptional regulator [Radiobacillus deserti]